MRRGTAIAAAVVAGLAVGAVAPALASAPAPAPAGPPGRKLVLWEGFSGESLNRDVWLTEVSGGYKNVNKGEEQYYSEDPRNVYIDHNVPETDGGALALEATVEPTPKEITFDTDKGTEKRSFRYASGRVQTEKSPTFTYGSMSARMKLPNLAGTFPAFWTLGLDGWRWPGNGEIDIMENIGDPRWTSAGVQFRVVKPTTENDKGLAWHGQDVGADDRAKAFPPGFSAADWHVYRADWSPGGIAFLIDEREIWRVTREQVTEKGAWVFDEPQYLILNMALGGPWAGGGKGLPDATKAAIARGGVRTLIDWVQVIDNRPPGGRIEAEDRDSFTGVKFGPGPDGGEVAGSLAPGDSMRFNQVDFGTGTRGVQVRAAAAIPAGASGNVEFRLHPTQAPIATAKIVGTGSWDTYTTVTAPITRPLTGVHTVFVTFTRNVPEEFVNIDWFAFDPPPQTVRGYWPMNEWSWDRENSHIFRGRAGTAGDAIPHGTFTRISDVRSGGGGAVRFDGVNSYASTAGPAVRTDQSFTVSAWVRLPKGNGFHTAVAQDGQQASGFYLQHAPGGLCTFAVPKADTADPEFSVAVGKPANLEKWTLLVGVYDAAAGEITLYVNGVAGTSVPASPFNATGPLTIGRSMFNGYAGNYWPGDIDDVRVVAGALTPAQIVALTANTPA
ncbi:LamG-like jellyroll fold domain-containing protein [Actinoplanes sp. NPDC051346]|uniref:LamG-like jellyroll fold domain-containing protein n=1 Tax=Actinoplanes sp. NPDC051346 TaxID=3155048 RepID=UPI00341D4890